MGYRIAEIELARPVSALEIGPNETGLALVARFQDRLIGFHMMEVQQGTVLSSAELVNVVDQQFARAVLEARIAAEIEAADECRAAYPSLTIAICTKDRAQRLIRLLSTLVDPVARSQFKATEIIVVDNAPSDASTAEAVLRFPDVRYVREPKAGLNFARNTALAHAKGSILAFLDDDVVVDRHWLDGLAAAWASMPSAGGFTGLVLPFRLQTEAQIWFEQRGGFGRGFRRHEWRPTSFTKSLLPVGSGELGAGCNMAFDRDLLRSIGGFDDALDTGSALPGGGDLDIFYRVLRAGRMIIYEPRFAVYHEHRETMAQLRRQYWSWGLGMAAFIVKAMRTDREIRDRQLAMLRWWVLDQLRAAGSALIRRRTVDLRFRWAELIGTVQGLAGGYDRSRRRIDVIRNAKP